MVEDLRREPGGGRSVKVRGKGGKEVWVALNKTTERAVLKAAAERSSGPLVRRPADRRRTVGTVMPTRPYNRQAVWELLRDLGRQAGIYGENGELDRLHPHLMRHGFIQALLDAGVGLAEVQDAARHASSDTTRRYDRMRDAYDAHPTHLLDVG
jgi:integrase/recombinase XerD